MTTFLTLVVSVLAVGWLYGRIAVAFAMIFDMTRIFHLAYGALFLIVGYAYYFVTIQCDTPVSVVTLAALFGAVVSSVLIYALVYARMLWCSRLFLLSSSAGSVHWSPSRPPLSWVESSGHPLWE